MPSPLSRVNRQKLTPEEALERKTNREHDKDIALNRDPFVGPVEERGKLIEKGGPSSQ